MTDFHLLITDWYRQNARSLPWRNTKNAYIIWLSEIILQQTRVNQGLNYFLKFQNNYPTVKHLAQASEQEVLSDWQGLGYYSRARNLHFTAKIVANEFNGIFPSSFDEIKKLKGIGDYTASAIASFAFDLPHAVVDGNVFRVLSRLYDIETPIDSNEGKKIFDSLAKELLGENPPAIHNQAIMEFGALQCVPANPNCEICPFISQCVAFKNKTISERPQKRGKIIPKNRYFHFLQFDDGENILLEKRTDKDIWQHLFQFPLIETDHLSELEEIKMQLIERFKITPSTVSNQIKHILTHQRIYAHVWRFDSLPKGNDLDENWVMVNPNDLINYPIPRLLDRYLLED
jgi:A/G-specific adenine glycosylase